MSRWPEGGVIGLVVERRLGVRTSVPSATTYDMAPTISSRWIARTLPVSEEFPPVKASPRSSSCFTNLSSSPPSSPYPTRPSSSSSTLFQPVVLESAPTADIEYRTMLITLGHCNWDFCRCTGGAYISESSVIPAEARCKICDHLMSAHSDYSKSLILLLPKYTEGHFQKMLLPICNLYLFIGLHLLRRFSATMLRQLITSTTLSQVCLPARPK